jgi:aryl-alcohol dehydrogenase-like predicted oxidoreductase
MKYRQLGSSGLTVSVVGVGCNSFGLTRDKDESREIVDAAIEAGVNLFDTAPNYGAAPGDSERFLGEAIASRRHEAVVSTKVGGFSSERAGDARGSRRFILRSVEESLGRLGTDFVDLLYLHQPDPKTPIEETLAAMDDLVRDGKVRYVASSNLSAWQIVEAELVARLERTARFIASQNAYSLIDRHVELDIVPVCRRYGIGITPYFPLAHGLLSGAFRPGDEPPAESRLARRPEVATDAAATEAVAALSAFASERGVTLLEVAIGALAAKPGVSSVITGASRPAQITANAAASEWSPTDEDLALLDEIAKPDKYIPLGSRTGRLR